MSEKEIKELEAHWKYNKNEALYYKNKADALEKTIKALKSEQNE